MKKILLLIVALSFSIISSTAQVSPGNSIKWSTPIDGFALDSWGQNDKYVILLNKMNGLLNMNPERNLVVLNSTTYKEVNRSEASYVTIDNKQYIYRWGTVFGDDVYAYVSEYVKDNSSNFEPLKQKSYIIRLSLPSLKIEAKWLTKFSIEIYNQPDGLFYDKDIKNNKHIAQFQVSPDGNKLFIFGFAKSESKKEAIYSTYSFDLDYKIETFNTLIDYDIYLLIQDDVIIDNSNNLWILYHTQVEDYFIDGIINPLTGDIYEWNHEFSVINKKMVLKDDDILIGGIGYQNHSFIIYQTLFNPNVKFVDKSTTPFEIKDVIEFLDKKTLADFKNNPANLPFIRSSIDGLKFTEDGSTILYGEEYKMEKYFNTTSMTHYTDFIWVAYLDLNNDLIKFKTIPKKQITFSPANTLKPTWGSYIPIINKGEIYFIFHDPKKNLKNNLHNTLKVQDRHYPNNTSICHVAKNGDMTRQQWIDNKKTKIYVSPSLSFIDLEGNLVMVSIYKRQIRLGKLKLD